MTATLTVLLFEDEGYGGKIKELNEESSDQPNLTNEVTSGVSSIVLKENAKKWQVFTHVNYHGAKVILQPGRRYTSPDAMGLDNPVQSMRRFQTMTPGLTVSLFEDEGYGGPVKELNDESQDQPNLTNEFTNGVSSIVMKEKAKKWQVCTDVNYQGVKVILQPGRRYTSRDAMGLDNPVQSMKRFQETGDVKESDEDEKLIDLSSSSL
ncbi:hypothetical protein OS493_019623 [Desmophyllum pertusum]|uniref:Beta/gamma crystallin 'Greek key' domain-containing protein n=1 Tax=Desmophyllum pertusum TaxID=174260 RepID=A0A9X0CYD6_9CNID|nr:hypothetical protein OS493_019623 [Desmophyllum pertusum]